MSKRRQELDAADKAGAINTASAEAFERRGLLPALEAERISGLWQRYHLGDGHPLVGATMPDLRLSHQAFQRPAPLWRKAAAAAGRQCAARSSWNAACAGRRAHTGYMGRIIWTILGVILAIWLAFTAIGGIFATLKTFLITGLIAAVVVIVVSLLARRPRRG